MAAMAVTAFPGVRPSQPSNARAAVAEAQKLHAVWSMAQLRFEVHRALPVLKAGADGEAVVTEVAKLAVCGRPCTEIVQVTAPDITDVASLGVRASDCGSIYRPPHEHRYCTLAHLDIEEQILAAAKRSATQLVSSEQAQAAGLDARARALGDLATASPGPGSPATSASWPPARPPPCARNTPGGPRPPRPTAKPPGSPTLSRPSHPARTAATPNSRTCGRLPSGSWRSATRLMLASSTRPCFA
jgi:hypothetical protein